MSKCVRAMYEKDPIKKKKILLLRVLISIVSVLPILSYITWASLAGVNTVAFVLIFVLIFPFFAIQVFNYVPMPWIFKIVWCSFFGGMPLIALTTICNTIYDLYYLLWLSIGIFVIGNLLAKFIRAFTEDELKVRGQILGFKTFLVTAELDKLNAMLEDDPEYYYNILPYCYVFGITKKMEEKFKSLHVEPPEYCNGNSASVVCVHICHSMNRIGGGSSFSGGGGSSGGGGGGHGSSGGGGGGGGCHGR